MTFNRQRTLVETLDSLLPQLVQHPEVELVVCDNASEDGTETFLAVIQSAHPQLRVHRNPINLGFDGNVVTCLKQAKGKYVAFFSDDDLAPEGHVQFLLKTLYQHQPVVLYCNHRPFLHGDRRQLLAPASPVKEMDSNGGEAFFFLAGLGFISSLVLAREPALRLLDKVIDGLGGAHVDIGSRLVLKRIGPCLYRGRHSVLARSDYQAASILIGGCVSLAKLYRSLVSEGLLSTAGYRHWLQGQLKVIVPRQVISSRGQGRGEYPLRGMLALYGRETGFFLRVVPLYLIPKFITQPAYGLLRQMLHAWRRKKGSAK